MQNHRHQLLIVEDDDSLRQILAWSFEDLGYQVQLAENCAVAKQLVLDQAFDCALLDYRLPDGDGVNLLEELRQQLPAVKGILMTAVPQDVDVKQAKRAGILALLAKPVFPNQLDQLFEAA